LLALDARVVLHAPDSDPAALPSPVIRPYPDQYSTTAALADGQAITIRPIRPEDEPLLVRFTSRCRTARSTRAIRNSYRSINAVHTSDYLVLALWIMTVKSHWLPSSNMRAETGGKSSPSRG
jgi:hypothetical protein